MGVGLVGKCAQSFFGGQRLTTDVIRGSFFEFFDLGSDLATVQETYRNLSMVDGRASWVVSMLLRLLLAAKTLTGHEHSILTDLTKQ